MDVALYADELKKKATLFFTQDNATQLATDMGAAESGMQSQAIMEVLPKIPNIRIQLGVEPVEITDRGAVVERKGKRETIPADTVVYSPEFVSNDDIASALEKQGVKVAKVGDCVEPMRLMCYAIHEGHAAAKKL